MKHLVILEIELEREVPDLAALIANRASAMSNVSGVKVWNATPAEEPDWLPQPVKASFSGYVQTVR